MRLRGIDFGNILGASGVQGFFGEGYWFHGFGKLLGLNFNGMTFVSKTATYYAQSGNMLLDDRYTPKELFPGCVKAKLLRGTMVNAVGLSNPGLEKLLHMWEWQDRLKPFMLSIMPLAETRQLRMEELRSMVNILDWNKYDFMTPYAIQVNLSCPNTGHDPAKLIDEAADALDILGTLDVPVMPKFSIASAPIEAVLELESHPSCDAICVSNTLPYGWEGLDWEKVWGSKTSPLAELGGGGLSGAPLLPLVCRWITRLREAGFTKPINGGGGILEPDDVDCYKAAGASSVFIGSVAALRPWRVSSIIERANSLTWD